MQVPLDITSAYIVTSKITLACSRYKTIRLLLKSLKKR